MATRRLNIYRILKRWLRFIRQWRNFLNRNTGRALKVRYRVLILLKRKLLCRNLLLRDMSHQHRVMPRLHKVD